MFCPDERNADYIKLKSIAGDYGAMRMVYRMVENEKVPVVEVYQEALRRFNTEQFPISERTALLSSKTPDNTDGENYKFGDKDFKRVSRVLDTIAETQYNFAPGATEYADAGTDIHAVANMIAEGVSDANIDELIREKNLPRNIKGQLRDFFKSIAQTGMILSEKTLSDITAEPIAGTADVIVLRNDGGIDLYDFKTVSWTPRKRAEAKKDGAFKLWDPNFIKNNYKARRYSTQLEFYSRMIENTVGLPVNGKFIVPIEVSFTDDDPTKPMENALLIGPDNGAESIETYNYSTAAREHVDSFYGVRFDQINYPNLLSDDTSQDFINTMIGQVEGVSINAERSAAGVPRGNRRGKDGYLVGSKFTEFFNQTDKEAQNQQIVSEYISTREGAKKNLEMSIVNYLKNGETSFFEQIPYASEKLQTILSPFVGKSGVQTYALNRIAGFKDKLNWIVIHDTASDTINLFYIGSEKLNDNLHNRSGSKALLSKTVDWIDNIVHFKSAFRNRYRDAKQIEAGLVVMKLKEANPNFGFGVVGLYSINENAPGYQHVNLRDVFNMIKGMTTHTNTKEMLPEQYKRLINDPVLGNYKSYEQDYAKLLLSHVNGMDDYRKSRLKSGLESYIKDKKYAEQLKIMVNQEINNKRIIKDDLPQEKDKAYELYMLSGLLFQLDNIAIDLKPISAFNNYGTVPFNINNELINQVNRLLQTAITRLSSDFWSGYKTQFTKLQDALFKEQSSAFSFLKDYTVGDTERNYTPLFATQEYDTYDENGKATGKKRLPKFEFVNEGSNEFKQLTDTQQKMITFVNDRIESMAKELKIDWVRGRLPMVRSDASSHLLNAIKMGNSAGYKNLLGKMAENFEENFGVGTDPESSQLTNYFTSQENNDKHDPRMEMSGIKDDNTVSLDKYNKWSNNLEVMMDVFMIQGLKYKNFQDVSAAIKAAHTIFLWAKTNLMQDRLGWNIKFGEWFYETMINNKDVDSGTLKNNITRISQKGLSFAVLALKPSSAITQTIGMTFSYYSRAFTNSLVNNGDFGIGDALKASGIVKAAVFGSMSKDGDYDKINLLMQRYRLFNQDLTSLLNGYHRNGDKSLFRSKFMFGMMTAGDWHARAKYMVAQMVKDGSWEAYTVSDGIIQYDETRDKRFNGGLPADQTKALRQYLIQSQPGNNSFVTDGYSDDMMNSIRVKANMLYGGFDRETRIGANFVAEGKLFTTFKNWVPSRIDLFFMGRQNNVFYGKMQYEKGADGETVAIWKGDPVEGRLFSLLAGFAYIRDKVTKKDAKPLTVAQKTNITNTISDVIMANAALLAANLVFGGDDDDNKDAMSVYSKKIVTMATADLLTIYELMTLDKFYWTPVTLQYANKQIENVLSVMTGESDMDRLTNNAPFMKAYNELTQNMDL